MHRAQNRPVRGLDAQAAQAEADEHTVAGQGQAVGLRADLVLVPVEGRIDWE